MLIKTPKLRINDAGFIHRYNKFTQVQIYNSGKSVLELKIGEQICINGACDEPLAFNRKFFGREHYAGLLEDIISLAPIFGGRDATKTSCGFTQNISELSLKYAVCGDKATFEDAKNRVKIEIKDFKFE